ncbi:hypothetical protein EZJ19_07835 [Parasulfuritortus cantonensis]|uniref:Uncharacterized protein n=1 Tax=Parasulfuritortus cantonensis TaxID=2528202 RepID=A0A4R1BDP9_9PROT|nr:hypothetical protein [Parasulfuritortus cantonensis]TCJ15210.1 hypothetical protein EZJ19_07835 [Parasulfuritortus cantonensis]
MPFIVEASTSDPAAREGHAKGNLADYEICPTRPKACEQTHRYHRSGYWVEVYDQDSGELLSGPINPDQPLPSYIV